MIQTDKDNPTIEILVLEDNEIDRLALDRFVKKQNLPYNLTFASTIASGRTLVLENRFDVILGDYHLADGEIIKLRDLFSQYPFIIITGQGSEEKAVKILRSGAADYLVKDNSNEYFKIIPAAIERIIAASLKDQRLKLLESVAINAKDAIVITNGMLDFPDPKIIYVNKAFTEISGYLPEEVLGRSPRILQGPKTDKNILKQIKAKLGQGDNIQVELINYNKNGEDYWIEMNIVPVKTASGRITHFISIQRDITAKKESELQLLDAKEKAEKAQQAEKIFTAKISHEIRTPLNAIIGMAHLLEETPTTTEQNNYIQILRDSSEILIELINDVLDFQKIQCDKVVPVNRTFVLMETLEIINSMFAHLAQKKGIGFETLYSDSLPQSLEGDNLLLKQILVNIISNAIKFTDKGAVTFEIKSRTGQEEHIIVDFFVKDTGCGIQANNLELIFEPFQQVHNAEKSGSGLGLSIVKQLVELMGGELAVSSTADLGSEFTISIPFKISAIDAIQNRDDQIEICQNFDFENKVLIVEDNKMNRVYLQRLLSRLDIPFDTALHGGEAMDFVLDNKYTLILMDLQMPVKDGYETTMAIRSEDNKNRSTPIVALTATAVQEELVRAMDAGMQGYLTKPFTPKKLNEVMHRYLNLKIM